MGSAKHFGFKLSLSLYLVYPCSLISDQIEFLLWLVFTAEALLPPCERVVLLVSLLDKVNLLFCITELNCFFPESGSRLMPMLIDLQLARSFWISAWQRQEKIRLDRM